MSSLPSTAGAFGRGPERRRHPRCRVIEKQLVTVNLGPQQRGLLIDVSMSGAAVQPYSAMNQGQAGKVKFEVPGEKRTFEADGVVTWVGPSGRVGLRFEKITEVAEDALQTWIARMMAPAAMATNHAVYSTAAYLPPSYSPWIKMSEVAVAQSPLDDDDIASLDLVSALRLVVERARSLTRATGAAIALADQTDMVCRARTGIAPDLGARFSPDTGLSGEVVRTGTVVRCSDTGQDPRVDRVACEHLNVRSIVIVPILSGRAVIGVIEVFSARVGAFDDRHVLNLSRLADLISAMLEAGMEGIASGASLNTSESHTWIDKPEIAPVSDVPGADRPDPLSELDEAIETESLLQTRTSSALYDAEARTVGPDEAAAADMAPQPDTDANESPADRHRTAEEINDIYERLRLENEAADRRRRNKIILSVFFALGLGAGGLGIARVVTQPSTPVQAAPVALAPQPPAQLEPQRIEMETPPPVAFDTSRAPTLKPAAMKTSKPSTMSERWTWNAPTAPGTGSELTLEAAAVAPVITDTIVGSRGDVKVISDMLDSWPASSPQLSAPEPQIKTVAAGKLISRINPIFPTMASAAGLHGRVELKVAIDKEGSVRNVEQVSGNSILGSAAVQAVRKWRYEPSQLDGRPVAVEKTIIIDFADPRKK